MASVSRAGTWPPWLKEAHLGVLTRRPAWGPQHGISQSLDFLQRGRPL